jgi:hypothetical protein
MAEAPGKIAFDRYQTQRGGRWSSWAYVRVCGDGDVAGDGLVDAVAELRVGAILEHVEPAPSPRLATPAADSPRQLPRR